VADLTLAELADHALSLGAAALIGAAISLHPLRLRRQRAAIDFDWDQVRAQILIAVAGALMVVVVGDSAARAFGLVGVGGFIRFRTSIRSPHDTALLFLLVGLGMACGLQLWATATVGAGFLLLVLTVLELGGASRPEIEPPLGAAEEPLF
jgi:hypothetical protein